MEAATWWEWAGNGRCDQGQQEGPQAPEQKTLIAQRERAMKGASLEEGGVYT